jgi:hypothetical protein
MCTTHCLLSLKSPTPAGQNESIKCKFGVYRVLLLVRTGIVVRVIKFIHITHTSRRHKLWRSGQEHRWQLTEVSTGNSHRLGGSVH